MLLLGAAATSAFGQRPKSASECTKVVPGDWGRDDQWHQHEALYWGCRLGVPAETVKEWQTAAYIEDRMQEVSLARLDGQTVVLITEEGGSGHCFDVKVLVPSGTSWTMVWELPEQDQYCSGWCPALKVRLHSKSLTVSTPSSSDPHNTAFTCKHVQWHHESFVWTGNTFERKSEPTP
jgi:hypothetical protein